VSVTFHRWNDEGRNQENPLIWSLASGFFPKLVLYKEELLCQEEMELGLPRGVALEQEGEWDAVVEWD
jgi:hypothetical protein